MTFTIANLPYQLITHQMTMTFSLELLYVKDFGACTIMFILERPLFLDARPIFPSSFCLSLTDATNHRFLHQFRVCQETFLK